MVVVFYVSGHGFGHASRSIELINTLGRQLLEGDRAVELTTVVRTSAPELFFRSSIRVPIQFHHVDTDSGVAQIDSLRLDEHETATLARGFYADFDDRVSREASTLRRLKASVVVADIPPLASAAAALARIPVLLMGNFTWDWIYEGYPSFERRAPGVIGRIADAYAQATRVLRLPLHGGFKSVRAPIVDIPFIARRSTLGRAGAREVLGLAHEARIVLGSFGGHGVELRYREIAKTLPFLLAVTDFELRDGDIPDNLLRFSRADLNARGCGYEDLVAASDVVVSKPGYGIVSECVANGTALLYTDRGRFREHDIFVNEMPAILRCRHISQDDLQAGRWEKPLEALLRQPAPAKQPPTDGAEVAAAEVKAWADSGRAWLAGGS